MAGLLPFGKVGEEGSLLLLLRKCPTLAVWGEEDGFTSARKLERWAAAAGFKWVEVRGAGHFWCERGVMGRLRGEVGAWVREVF